MSSKIVKMIKSSENIKNVLLKKTLEIQNNFVPRVITGTKRELAKKNVYQKFLGSLIKKGNINAAKRHIDSAFINVSEKHKSPLRHVFTKIFSKLTCRLEMKKVKMRRNTHMIPFPIRSSRQDFLKIKWILNVVKKDKRKVSQTEKLSTELLDILINKRSKVLMEKKQLKKEALTNRSNTHFR